jgi:hypothetical protein
MRNIVPCRGAINANAGADYRTGSFPGATF